MQHQHEELSEEPGSSSLPPTLNNDVQAPGWYYEENGQRKGPVSQAEMEKLIKMDQISYGSLIWKKGLTDWTKVENSELSSYLPSDAPPPLSGDHVKNTYLWILAFAPIFGSLLTGFVLSRTGKFGLGYIDGFGNIFEWIVPITLNILLCCLDSHSLKKAGHDTSKFLFWIILIPVYIYSRAKHLKQSQICLIVWIIVFALTILYESRLI